MSAYYNENDPAMAAWLAELMARGLIAKGHIDTRSITEVQPSDLNGFTQCHFFAGIGGWSAALRLAGWADDRPVWTGSCPCQPFSVAGKGRGKKDPRHLWPQFRRLIRKCRPATVFGEQVASADGRVWLSGVFADLEALAYRAAGADLCAAGVGAPHIRQRLYWVANAESEGPSHGGTRAIQPFAGEFGGESYFDGLANAERDTRGPRWIADEPREGIGEAGERTSVESGRCGDACGMEHPTGNGREQWRPESSGRGLVGGCSISAWSDFRVVHCLDGKARRIGTGIQPLAYGVSGRVAVVRPAFGSQPANPEEVRWVNRRAALQGAGNAIVPQLAAEFIAAFDDVLAAADADRAPAVAGV